MIRIGRVTFLSSNSMLHMGNKKTLGFTAPLTIHNELRFIILLNKMFISVCRSTIELQLVTYFETKCYTNIKKYIAFLEEHNINYNYKSRLSHKTGTFPSKQHVFSLSPFNYPNFSRRQSKFTQIITSSLQPQVYPTNSILPFNQAPNPRRRQGDDQGPLKNFRTAIMVQRFYIESTNFVISQIARGCFVYCYQGAYFL